MITDVGLQGLPGGCVVACCSQLYLYRWWHFLSGECSLLLLMISHCQVVWN